MRELKREIIFALVMALAYLPTLIWMWDRWFAKDSYYSHGILIPFVTGYLIWQKRKELGDIEVSRSPWGITLIVLGIAVYMLSSVFRIYFSSGFSMMIVIFGYVLHFFGVKFFKKILFPLSFLFFMFPLPMVVIVNISFKMKMFAAEIAKNVLNGMGLWAMRDGSIIKMPHAHVIVDDVCSGLRSLISLAALGSIFAYWLEGPMWKRALLFLTTIPIAVLTNVCRVVFLASVSEIWGPRFATGALHDASGFMVFALAFFMLFAAGKLIE